MATHNPKTYRFFLMTIDPVHVGTGGARLGRVDNPIVREPGTNLPKIPGSSLHGAIRAYAAHRYGKPRCAGQGQPGEGKEGHCARPTCPICYTFGYARDREGGHAGVVAISDARILLFPVYSMVGPVWVTSPAALEAAGFRQQDVSPDKDKCVSPDKAKWGGENGELPTDKPINLGWLMVEREGDLPTIPWHSEIPEQIRKRVVLVSDKLFSQIVNSNLEVRTSVAINPETGAAEEHALFTYEAIPRATILWMDVVVSDYRGEFPSKAQLESWEQILQGSQDEKKKDLLVQWRLQKEKSDLQQEKVDEALRWLQDEKVQEDGQQKWRWEKASMQGYSQDPLGIVQAGLQWVEYLGIGGMGTRGFGRICCLGSPENSTDKPCSPGSSSQADQAAQPASASSTTKSASEQEPPSDPNGGGEA